MDLVLVVLAVRRQDFLVLQVPVEVPLPVRLEVEQLVLQLALFLVLIQWCR